jgi:hypothetical protein
MHSSDVIAQPQIPESKGAASVQVLGIFSKIKNQNFILDTFGVLSEQDGRKPSGITTSHSLTSLLPSDKVSTYCIKANGVQIDWSRGFPRNNTPARRNGSKHYRICRVIYFSDKARRKVMAECTYCHAATELFDNAVAICIQCSQNREAERKHPTQDLRTTLLQDLVEATRRSHQALGKFDAVLGQFPSGLPHPDGAQLIKNASNELSIAQKEMMKAQNRLNDYVARGSAPEDLKISIP